MTFSSPDPIYCSDIDAAWVRVRTFIRDRSLSKLPCTIKRIVQRSTRVHIGYHCVETGQQWRIHTSLFGD